jgi:hypothetical protein
LKLLHAVLINVLLLVLLAVPPLCLQFTGNENMLVPHFWVLFSFLSGLTFIMVTTVLVVQQIQPGLYAQAFLGVTVVKMIGSMLLALLFVLKMNVNERVFMLDFFYLYFLNTGFEVYVLLRNLRNQN